MLSDEFFNVEIKRKAAILYYILPVILNGNDANSVGNFLFQVKNKESRTFWDLALLSQLLNLDRYMTIV